VDVVEFARHMYKLLRQREQDLSSMLADDGALGWDHYKMVVGEIRGLAFAQAEIKALLEKTADDVEDIISS